MIGVAGDRAAKKRKKAFWDRYGSFEGFRGQVDTERIQRVLRASGDIAAIEVVRKEYPYGSLAMAKRYVDELPVRGRWEATGRASASITALVIGMANRRTADLVRGQSTPASMP
ncbi:hypothetical protein [Streptomyces sp. NPDC005046]